MDYKEHIEKAIRYIEDNLTYELDLSACAKEAGYSKYHFLRIFLETVKLTPADYIRKRRITEIVKRMNGNAGNVSDVAFEYGFNSRENFIRAFKREHHILPSEYKLAGNSLKLYEPFTFHMERFEVRPQIITLDGFRLMAYESDEEYPPNFWNKYNSRKYSRRLSGGGVCEDYGVCRWNHKQNRLDYYIGIRKENALGDATGTIPIDIPGGRYAKFTTPDATHFSFVTTIRKTWDYINNRWLPQADYQRAEGYELESYVEQSRIFKENIYIPIRRRNLDEKA